MKRYYAADRLSWSKPKAIALGILMLIAIGVVVYLRLTGDLSWQRKAVVFLVGTALLVFSILEQLWPVVSIDAHSITVHKFCWPSTKIALNQIESVVGDGAVLTVTTNSGKLFQLNLLRLSDSDREIVRRGILESA